MTDPAATSDSIPVPHELFRELLPRITNLEELKIVLHVVELARRRGTRGVPIEDLLSASVVQSVVGTNSPEPAELRLGRVLDRAIANGSLVRIAVQNGASPTAYFFLSTRENRELVQRLRADDPGAAGLLDLPPETEVSIYRPNVFTLYEQQIGPLTPLVAEHLREAERSYPRGWIEGAISAAVHYNKRSWRYIESILSRWEETGGP